MPRPRAFDRDTALRRATEVFWRTGFAATSTDDLLDGMGIGRQSLYNTFGDKRTLYLEVLDAYQQQTVADHLARLEGAESPIEGLRALLRGIAVDDDAVRALGCLGVNSVEEFGTRDDEVTRITGRANRVLGARIADRLRVGVGLGEVDRALDVPAAVEYVLLTMTALQVSARSGSDVASLHRAADFAVDRLRA